MNSIILKTDTHLFQNGMIFYHTILIGDDDFIYFQIYWWAVYMEIYKILVSDIENPAILYLLQLCEYDYYDRVMLRMNDIMITTENDIHIDYDDCLIFDEERQQYYTRINNGREYISYHII